MFWPPDKLPEGRHVRRWLWAAAAVWAGAILVCSLVYVLRQRAGYVEVARTYARAAHEKDVVYRRWNALIGGVYVPVSEKIKPNPYLKVPEREVTTPSGRVLTLVNPAYMTRQVHEIAAEQGGARAKITSLRPMNPVNTPDAWERAALEAFENGKLEVSSIELIDDQPYVRLIRPLFVEKDCLKCHGDQGYRLGQVRGGISVSVPISGLLGEHLAETATVLFGFGVLWLLGSLGIACADRSLLRRIAEREQGMERLQRSEERFRRLFEQSNDAILVADGEGRILDANGRACEMSRYPRDELIGLPIHSLHGEGNEDFVDAAIKSILEHGGSRFESQCLCKDGTVLDVEFSARRIDDPQPLILGILRDVTERKRIEAAQQSQLKLLETLLETIPSAVFYNDAEGRYLGCNRTFAAWAGKPREGIVGRTVHEVFPADLADRLQASDAELARRAGQEMWESVVQLGDGIRRHVLAQKATFTDGAGSVAGIIGVVTDITGLKQSEAELARAKEAAEAANRAKGEFLANMSHEIRTPLTAILGYSDLLTDPQLSEADRQSHLETVRRNGHVLLKVLNDILHLSKIDAGKVALEISDCSLWETVDDVVSLMRVRTLDKPVTLQVEHVYPLPQTVRTDPTRLRQILMNLVANAVKFTERGTVLVTVRLVRDEGTRPRIEFDIQDTGVGMTPEETSRLFQPFSQADASTTRRFGGTGLGLAISSRLAKLLGGDIKVESWRGVGSTFTLSIEPGSLENVPLVTAPPDATLIRGKFGAAAASTTLSGRVLLAEDGLDNQRLIGTILRKAGVEVDMAENGRIACEKALQSAAEGSPYDLVLMDMQMPEFDGYQATRELRTKGWCRPIIALTAHAMSSDRLKCLEVGCDDFLSKPIEKKQFLTTVAQYLVSQPQPLSSS